jgi:hypothetical protein
MFQGCSGGSSVVYHHFKAVVCGPERGREGDPVVVDRHIVDDVLNFTLPHIVLEESW